jgi:hypothetical protein
MRRAGWVGIGLGGGLIGVGIVGLVWLNATNEDSGKTESKNLPMHISSPAFGPNQTIPVRHTCDGEGVSPALDFSDIPGGTVSLVLIMEDPDVPASIRPDGMWDHWLVWNIPPDTPGVGEGEALPGVSGQTTSNTESYVPPCPPDREHRYFFKLFALDTVLDLPAGTTKADLIAAMAGHVLAEAELVGRYDRQ